MKINTLVLGILDTNCYILEQEDECIVIDPADDYETINDYIKDKNVVGIIITHYHFDHIGALDELVNINKIKVYDNKNLKEGTNTIGNFTFDVIYTPGHKEDLISIYFNDEKILFSGDFIFNGTIGRYDLVGSNIEDMKTSIKKALTLPEDITIYPGHGPKTTLMNEIDNLKRYI